VRGQASSRLGGPRARIAAVSVAILVATSCNSSDGGHSATAPPPPPGLVTALGRIEPRDGITRIAGPSRPSVVVAKLLVDEGDHVAEGQAMAELDTMDADQAAVTKARAALKNAEAAMARVVPLVEQRIASREALDTAELAVDTARADLAAAQAVLGLDVVRAPAPGRIVKIYTRRGERVGQAGFAEIAQTDQMFVVAEVYETDVGRVAVGQSATARSPAIAGELTGTVDRIGTKVGKQDVLATDPVARTDARVVEVRVKLADSPKAASLSNLQVEVAIQTADRK
jgi:HlyD family secretion protein